MQLPYNLGLLVALHLITIVVIGFYLFVNAAWLYLVILILNYTLYAVIYQLRVE